MLSVGLQYAAAMAPRTAIAVECESYAIFTSDPQGETNNQNIYDSKSEVWLNGGPTSAGGSLTAGTIFYYQVQEPDGTPLSEIRSVAVEADGPHAGRFFVGLAPFDTTTNSGGEYKVVVSADPTLAPGGCTKSDNFKIDDSGSLRITKDIQGGPGDFGSDFDITVDCGPAGTFNVTVTFPEPGEVTIPGIDAGAVCTIEEIIQESDPPLGYHYDPPIYSGNPATIVSGETVTIAITNVLVEKPAPSLGIVKSVSLAASGPWVDELTVATGTTVYYRITISNTGNIALTNVSLSDDKFDLAGCTVPSTLAVGASYDCEYSDVAETGTLVNTATVDSEETGPADDDATVIASPAPAPSLGIVKSVSLDDDGPWVDELTVTTGTTVYYQVIVTNTGNVPLHGVELDDDIFDMSSVDCDDIGTLDVGEDFTCTYTDVAQTGTTVNTATADSDETEPVDDDATVIASPAPTLTITKTNNAPLDELQLPTADEGDTVTFTLAYSHTGDDVTLGVITDVLPVGLTYVDNSATGNAEFTFDGYDVLTRTLTWTAASVSASGSVTYQATVDEDAAELAQPLENVATIDSEETNPDSDESDVFVAAPPQAETSVPTPPQTDIGSTESSASGASMLLALLALAGIALGVIFVAPTPASIRKRIDR